MERILHKYKQVAYLSYQIIVHFKHSLVTDNNTLILLDVKHIQDTSYQPIILTISNHTDFDTAFQSAFIPVCEDFHSKLENAKQSKETKKKVTFNNNVHIRLIEGDQYTECNVHLTQ